MKNAACERSQRAEGRFHSLWVGMKGDGEAGHRAVAITVAFRLWYSLMKQWNDCERGKKKYSSHRDVVTTRELYHFSSIYMQIRMLLAEDLRPRLAAGRRCSRNQFRGSCARACAGKIKLHVRLVSVHDITLSHWSIFGYRAVLCCQCDLREFTEIGIYTRFWNIWESFRDRTGRLLAGRYMVFY